MLPAGPQPSALPDEVTALFDLRLVPEENPATAIKSLQSFVQKVAKKNRLKVTCQIDSQERGFSSLQSHYAFKVKRTAESVLKKKLTMAAEFGGIDGMHTAHAGIPTVNIGPGQKDAHTTTEHMAIKDLEKTVRIIRRLITS